MLYNYSKSRYPKDSKIFQELQEKYNQFLINDKYAAIITSKYPIIELNHELNLDLAFSNETKEQLGIQKDYSGKIILYNK